MSPPPPSLKHMRQLTIKEVMTLHVCADLRGDYLTRMGTLRWLFTEPPTHVLARYGRLLDDLAAEAAWPTLVRRGRRMREARRAARAG